jgi:peptidyl-prolyl cis-trans isomerase B (cyclophilin B)
MKKYLLLILLFAITSVSAKPKHDFIRIKTNKGECIIMLYNQTPKHHANFLKLAKEGFYNGTLFHRVIQEFMIQGGDPNSKTAIPGQALGSGDLGYRVPAEFRDSLFHKKGALAAARDNNPEKASSASQFYIVHGKRWTDATIEEVQQKRMNGIIVPEAHRKVYKELGGTPHLDQNYTVFGEVIQGIEMVDAIAEVKKSKSDRPEEDIKMEVSILKNKEAKKIEKKLGLKNNTL